MSVIVTYNILPTEYINDKQYNSYSDFIKQTLTDPRGWSKSPYNYYFKESNDNNAIKVRFVDNNFLIKKYSQQINKLSCYVPSEHAIYFNLENWNNGGWEGLFPDKKGEDGLTRYRQYVINHEFGHALGLNHPNCKSNKLVSVMEQNTKGLKWLNRCCSNNKKIREYNPWPLDSKKYNEETGDGNNKLTYKIQGGSKCDKKLFWFLFIMTLIIVIIIIICNNSDSTFIPTKQPSSI